MKSEPGEKGQYQERKVSGKTVWYGPCDYGVLDFRETTSLTGNRNGLSSDVRGR